MSRRTAEASKAIREAWENEQQLVTDGKGTRDWTPEQQQSIIDVGKAYDEDGKAFIGHHMKSAEAYPEYQGDPENIQFLSYAEHLKAHDGNWRNPSNWYYDPVTGDKHDFGNNKYVPCDIVELSEPLSQSAHDEQQTEAKVDAANDNPPKEETITPRNTEEQKQQIDYSPPLYTPPIQSAPKQKKGFLDKAADFIGGAVEWAKDFAEEHPVITTLIGAGITIAGKAAVDSMTSKHNSSHSSEKYNPTKQRSSHSFDPSDGSYDDYDDSGVRFNDDNTGTREYPDERSSPTEHDVSGYTRQQNGKTVNVRPYKRGGKQEEMEEHSE